MTAAIFAHVRWRWLALAVAPTLLYAHTLGYGFIDYDDTAAIANLALIGELSWQTLPRCFAPGMYDGLLEYMPLQNLSFAVDRALFGPSASAFRPQHILWYVASVLAVYGWLRSLLVELSEQESLRVSRGAAEWIAFGTSLLFALHPVHVESVTWLVGRKDVLSGFFLPAACGCGLAYSLRVARSSGMGAWLFCASSLLFLALGLLSNPTALAIAPLLLVQELWVARADFSRDERRRRLRALACLHAPAWVLTFAFAAFYARVVAPSAQSMGVTSDVPVPTAAARVGEQLARNLQLVLEPSASNPIVPEHWFSVDPRSLGAVTGYVTAAVLAAIFVGGLVRRWPLALAVALFVVPSLPSLLGPVAGQHVAGRYLYHAVLGPTLALAWLFALTLQRHERLRPLLIAAAGALALVWAGTAFGYSSAIVRAAAPTGDESLTVQAKAAGAVQSN
jgi:hypothetical protein